MRLPWKRDDECDAEERVARLERETAAAVAHAREVVAQIRGRHARNHYGETYEELYRGRRA